MIQTISLIIPDVRSSENVGSMFRTADALGIENIYLVGYSPRPLDKFNRPDSKIAKTALGAEQVVPWEYTKTIAPIVRKLKKDGYTILALEQTKNSMDYRKISEKLNVSGKDGNQQNLRRSSTSPIKVALIVGNEVTGISKSILKYADYVAQIPMRGKKESLNVAVATGIMLSELTRLW